MYLTPSIFLQTIHQPTKTLNTTYDKYETSTCFGTAMPSSGIIPEQRNTSRKQQCGYFTALTRMTKILKFYSTLSWQAQNYAIRMLWYHNYVTASHFEYKFAVVCLKPLYGMHKKCIYLCDPKGPLPEITLPLLILDNCVHIHTVQRDTQCSCTD